MKQSIFTILENKPLTRDVYRMVLAGDTSAITASGQFVNIQLSGKFLRLSLSLTLRSGNLPDTGLLLITHDLPGFISMVVIDL